MSDYLGKICPYCKTVFTSEDEVVLCSLCDMPHHKDCWVENQGCTTFGCSGAIKPADSSASSVTATEMNYDVAESVEHTGFVFCTQCGTKNANAAVFCLHCGNRLSHAVPPAPQPTAYAPANSGATRNPRNYSPPEGSAQGDPDIIRFIGKKTDYYLPRFQQLKSQNKQTSWNWCAFLFAPYWLIYRKMYGYGAAVLGAAAVITLLNIPFISLVGYIAFGIFANNIYLKHLEEKVRQAKTMSEPFKAQFIAKHAGVNILATVLYVIGYGLLLTILL